MVLTWQHGKELANAILEFEKTTAGLSGSPETYYQMERSSFSQVAAEPELSRLLAFWDRTYEQKTILRLASKIEVSDLRVLEYSTGHATVTALVRWHETSIDPITSEAQEQSDKGGVATYWLVLQDGIWKVSEFGFAPPNKP
jgi:hypothetical protein